MSNELDTSSPTICRPYLASRERIAPILQPYYDTYAAPNIEKARPYIQQFNDKFYTPSVQYGKETYNKYGAPQIELARNYSEERWFKVVKPQIDAAQLQAQSQYTANVAPHVSKASIAAAPYYSAGKDGAFDVYNKHIIPRYEASRPYIENVYATGQRLTLDVGFPYVRAAWTSVAVFFDRVLWPKLRILYGENVEPQLVRIGERLGRYRDGRKIQSVVEEVDSFSTAAAASSSIFSTPVSMSRSSTTGTASNEPLATPSSSLTPEQAATETRNKIDNDLKNWRDKFARAAEKGTEDLQERISDITARQSSQLEGVGNALLVELEHASSSEESKFQKKVLSIVKTLGEAASPDDITKAKLDVSTATRKAGINVKQKAEALRDWKGKFDAETLSLTYAAGNSTLDVVNSIRDVGLQEIGIRWANMEGVTYKDWSKYHDVKKTFDELSKKVAEVAQSHSSLRKTIEASDDLESTAMDFAKAAAKELTRLKEVGIWKIDAHDSSDDFSTKYMTANAAAAAQMIKDKASAASERMLGTSHGTVESMISKVSQEVSAAASDASSAVVGTEPGIAEQITSKVRDSASVASQQASEAVIGTQPGVVEKAESQVLDAASAASEQASQAVMGSAQPQSESIYSRVSEAASEASKHASEVVLGNEPVIANEPVLIEEATSQVSEAISKASQQASEAVLGTPQPKHESVYSAAKDKVEQAVSDASEAVIGTPAPVYQSVASEISKSAELAESAISDALVGSSTPLTESVSSSADEAISSISSVASEATKKARKVYGGAMAQDVKGQMPILEDVIDDDSNVAYSERLQSLISQAGDRYAEITKAVEEAVRRPTTTQGSVKSASSIASEQYLKALSAASRALYGTEQAAVESATSIVSDKWSDAVAA